MYAIQSNHSIFKYLVNIRADPIGPFNRCYCKQLSSSTAADWPRAHESGRAPILKGQTSAGFSKPLSGLRRSHVQCAMKTDIFGFTILQDYSGMAEDAPDVLANAINAMNRANLRGLATADQWTDLVNEYFVYAEEEEGHKEEKHRKPEPPEADKDPQDPVEDKDEPLIITDSLEKNLQDEWDQCENFL